MINIFYIDLYEHTKTLDPSELKLPYDGHWSPMIHKLFANELYRMIMQIRTP